MSDSIKYLLEENKLPKNWYNISADLPKPLSPVLHPGTLKPVGPDDLAPLFPMALIGQEVSQEREIEIPEPVREIYKQWRPSPLYRARKLEKALDTTAKIYYKYENPNLKFPFGSDYVFRKNIYEKIQKHNVDYITSNAVGGLSNIWATLVSPFYRQDISDWDIQYDEYYKYLKNVEEIMMVASHSFDIIGAKACGYKGAYINRYNLPVEDLNYLPDITVMDFYEFTNFLVRGIIPKTESNKNQGKIIE